MNLKTAVDLGGRRQALEAIKVATASHFTNLMTTAVSVTACRHKTWAETESSTAVFRMNHRFVNLQKIATRFSFGWIAPALMLLSLAGGLQAQQITLVTTTIPGGTVGFPYATQLVKSGGTGIGPSYSITAGALPAGVTLNASTGLISGTPTAAGTFTPTIQVTDTSTTIDSKNYSIVVRAAGILNTRWQGTQGTTQTYTGGAVIGAGGDQWNSFFVGTGSGTNLLDNAGVATPIGVSWTSDIAWHNLDRNGFCTPSPNGFCPLMNGYLAKNSGVVANVNFSGLPANSSWDMLLYQQIDSGGSRRISVTINGTTTALTTTDNSGTDSTFIQGKNYLVVTANTDGSGNFNVAYRGVGPDPEGDINGIQLRPHVSGASITQTVAPSGPVSTAYNLALLATGGSGSGRVWSIASGSLPPGLTLNSSTGVLSGTPTATGTYNFTVLMVDSAANTATQAFTLNIQQATTTTLTSSVNPSNFQQDVTLTATVSPSTATGTVTFKDGAATIGSGTLSAGIATMSISNLTSGAHSLTAVYGGNTTNLTSTSSVLTQNVRTAVVVSTTTLPNGQISTVYSQTLAATGGVSPYTWSLNSGALPSGVTLSGGGLLSGLPTVTGTFNVNVLAIDSVGGAGAQALSLVVNAAPLSTITTLSVAGCSGSCVANVSQAVSLQAAVTQGGNSVGTLGSVAFFSNIKILGVAPVSSGTATLATTTIPGGTTSLRAIYLANGTYASSKSSAVSIAVSARGGNGFATATSYSSGGTTPSLIAVADVTGDGIADMVVAHSGGTPSSVGVLKGNGSGGFAAVQNFTVGTDANSIGVGDFNSDGKLDIAVTNGGSSNFSILLNTSPNASTLSFAAAVNYAAGLNPQTIGMADFNGDGIADLALTNFIAPVTVNLYFGVGNGTFPASPSLTLTGPDSYATALEAGDLNGDGSADLAVGTGSNLVVFLNTGPGAFGSPNTFASAAITNAVSLAIADYNSDGKADVALTNYQPSPNGTVVVLLNNSGEVFSFGAGTTYTIGANPWGIAAGDFTGDGNLDLAAVNLANDNVNLLLGSANGSFTVAGTVAVGSFPKGIAVGDVNADGVLDFVTANSGSGVSVLLGVGTTTTSLTSSVNPTNFGQSTTLTATISPSTATGTVTFKDGATTIGAATLTSGTATLSISSLASGSRSLTAVYGGNSTNGTSTSGGVSQTVRTAVVISTTTLTPARQGSAYSVSLGVSGGTGPYTWAVSSGALPAGLTLSTAGLLSGTPTVNGSFSFSATATDSLGGAGVQSLSLIVNTVTSVFNGQQVTVTWTFPDVTTTYVGPATATVGAGYEFVNFFGGNQTFNIDFSDTTIQIDDIRTGGPFGGTTFNGLVISNPGGLPAFTNVTLTAANWTTSGGVPFDNSRVTFDATHIYLNFQGMDTLAGYGITLQVNGISLPTTIPGSSVGFPYSTQLTTTGGTGTGRVYALASGALPNGLTLNTSTGVISGIPTTAGTFTPTLQVTDSGSKTTSRAYSVVIRQAGLLNTRWQGSPSTVYTGPGFIGNGSDTWNLFETGSGSGTLLDNAGQATPVAITWTADGALSPQPFDSNAFCYPSPTSFCSLMGNYLYKSGGTAGNVTFSNLPANASWDIYLYQQSSVSNGGRQISITANGVTAATTIPNDPNDSTFLLNKNYLLTTASTNGSGQLSITFQGTAGDLEANINGLQLRPHLDPLTITQTTIPAGTVGATYSTTLTLTGGTGVGNVFVVSSEVGPGNLTLSSGGVLSGTPSTAGSFPFTVRVTDSQGNIANRALTLVVNPPVSVTTTSLPTGVLGAAYNFTLAAAGGSGSYTWSITSGAIHGGLSLNAATGAITGTPIQTGNPSVVFRATDTNGQFAAVQFTLTVNPAVSVTTSVLPGGAVGTAYSQTLAATGGLGGYTWSITSGALQAGLSLNSATGAITGTPTVSGPANITFRATDTGSNFGAATIALTIAGTTTTSLSTSLGSPSPFSANQSLTATVSPLSTGRVTFYDGARVVGIATLSSGTATISGKLLGTGTHSLRAYFQGSADGLPSLSSSVVQLVNSKPQSGFAAGVGYAAGTGPSLGTSADFNGDGNADYAVANYGASNISVFLGNGLGVLGAATNFTVGTNPFALTTGDFNGDGNVDIATANLLADSISVLLGNGAGSFAAGVTYTAGVGAHPGQIIAADFNRDGFVDLATANYNSNNISVLFGAGNGTFGTGALYSTGTNPAALAAGDFNNDGIPDLAVANQTTNNVSILLGQAGGVFAAATNYPAGGTTLQGVTTADFNADGNLDLVVTNSGTNTVTLLAGTGSGTFGTASLIGASSGANFTVAGDFNGNGVPDVAVTNDTGSNVSVLIGSGSLTFASPVNYALAPGASGAKGITVTDLNGDGVSDLVVASSTSNSISVLLGVATTTITLTSSVNPSNLGAATTLTATVSPSTATGTVTYKDGAATLGTGTLSGGVATFAASLATAGVHSLTAVYAGNATNTTSTSSALTQNVNQGTTTTSLSSQTNPTTYAGTATFTATVAPSTAAGTVTFRLGGLTLGTGTLSGGTASFSTTTLAAGAYSLDAVYGGDSNYVTSTSTALTQTVNARTTTTSLSTSLNPSTSGQTVTLTATVTPSSATGSVTFKNGAATLGSGTLSSGVATFGATSLAVGGHSLTALYDGDGNNATSTSSAVNQIVNAPLVITTSSLPYAVQNTAYNQTLTATGGSGSKTWAITVGVLPTGLNLNSATSAITGTPTVPGAESFTVEVTDALGNKQTASLFIQVNAPLTLITNTLSTGTVKFPYFGSIFASGGSLSGYTFAVSAGSLPPGLSLNATTGVVDGSPTTAGTYNFTARVTDSSTATATQPLTITVDGYGVTNIQFQDPSDSPHFGPAVIGNPVDLWNVFKSPTGTQPILYDEAGNLISVGLTFSGASVATTGTTSGFCSPAVTPYCDLMKSHLRVEAGKTGAISLKGFNPGSTWSLYLYSQSNLAGRTLSVAVNGGAPVVTSTGNPADATFILNKNYLIIPAVADGTGEINLAFTSANGLEVVLNGLQVTPQVPTLTITTSSLPSGVAGSAYSQTLAGTGGTTLLYDWTISAGALPSGLALNPTTGVISGTPSVAGTFNLTVTLEDGLSYTASRALTLQVNPVLSITTSTLPSGVQNVGYSQTLVATGGAGSNVWSLQSGTLPAGLNLSAAGVISGTPTATGNSSFTVRVTDSGSQFVLQSLTIVINGAVSVTTSTLPNAVSGVAYNTALVAANGLGGFTWSITSGTLPSGLTLNPATGVISGTAASATTANITVRAADTGNNAATANLSLQVLPPVTITTLTLPEGVRNFTYSQNSLSIVATGATNVYTFAISAGTLPAGLTLSPAGLLAGTPSVAGTFTFTVRVTDASTSQATQQYTLVINASLIVSTVTLPPATQGTLYSQALTATGGVAPLTWAIVPTSTASQAGLTINPTTGLLSGTPNTFGKLDIDIQLQDFAGNGTTRNFSLVIARNGTSATDFAVSDASTRIVRMSATGTNILTVCTGVNCHAGDIAADPQGNIYSHDTTGIYKITPGGVVTTLLSRPGGGVGGVAVDASGNVIFVDNRSDEIYRVTQAGVLTTVAAFPDASTQELQDVFVALDIGGNYIVGSDAGSTMRIYRFTPAGAVTTLATWSGKGVTGIAVGIDGKIAFTDYRNLQLAVFDPAGSPNNVVTYEIPQGEGTLPLGLTIDPTNGHYIVPERYSRALYRITPGGAITEMFSGTPLTSPASIAAIPALAAPVISTLSLPSGLVGQNYGSFQLVATGGTGNFTWTAIGLPAGLTMSTGGIISGGSSAAGTFQINITVTDVLLGLTATKLIPLTIASPIAPVTLSSSSSQANIALGGTVSASFAAGGGVPPYTFSASGLPQGVSLNGAGSLSGSPASPGNSTATIFVSDASGRSASTSFSITVLGILISSLPNGTTGIPYSATIGALGGVQPYSFSANGLPNGLGLSAQGTIAGTPTVGGNFNVTVTVSDGAGARISAGGTITIVVPGAPVSIPSGSLPDATVGVPYSASLSAIGGKTPYSWSVLSGSLPDGLSFGANGIVSGTPTAPGGGGFAALVTDSSGGTASTGASITVKPAPIVITSKSPLASGMLGVEYPSVQLAATGGIAPYKWAVSGGAFPAGVALDSGGTISGTPTAAGDFTATVTVTDAAGTAGSGGFSVTIRQISADLILSSATAAFELTTGAVALPSGLAIGVQSTVVAQQISFAVVTSPSVPWLTVTNGNKTPDSISVVLSNGALNLPAGDYSTTLKVTCSTGSCSGSAQSVAVTLKVTSPPARLKVVTDILSFSTTSQNLAPISQTIAIQNAGGGSLGVASVSCGAPWCTVGVPPAALAGGSSANIPITVNPGAVSAGYYRTTVEISTSGGKGSVPVTLFIAQNSSMTLSPSGGQFGMPQGGAPGNPSGSFLVTVNSTSAVTFTASQLQGADWLKVGISSVSASSAQPGTISYSIDTAAAGRLTQGTYYGQISVGGTGIVNAPQTHQVILNVTPPTDVARPDPQPAGLLFLTTLGGTNPPPQIVTVFTSSTRAVQFQASATSDGGWLSVSPGLGTTSQPAPAGTNATVNIAGLKQGVYTGLVSYAFAGNAVRSVNVTLVVSPVGGTAATLTSSTGTPSVSAPLQPRATCTATSLAAVQTGIVSNFSAPAACPTPLSLRIVDDCGGTVTGAQIVSTFSNGDPPLPLPLVDSKNGVYAGTWTPRKQSATLTISARVTAKGYKDLSMQLLGAVTPNAAPLLTPNGTVHAFSPLVGAPLAPGNIVAVYGSNLAVLTGVPTAVPLPTAVNGTQVLIGGIKAPLYFTSPGQVNAQIPYELEPNKQYQVIISANGALSTPDAIQLTNVVPGLAAYADGTVIAQHADGSLITAKSPAKGGETAIAYLSGLGATDNNPASGGAAPGDILARPNSLPTLSIGGKDAKIAFVGLTPGLVGLYQMNFEVPEGLDAGNPRITVTQEGSSSTPVLLPYVPK